MLVIITQQKHAIPLRVSHCDYTPRASKSVATPQLVVTHKVKNAAHFVRNPQVHYRDQDSTSFNTPLPHIPLQKYTKRLKVTNFQSEPSK